MQDWVLPAKAESVGHARRLVSSWATDEGANRDVVADARLAVSEAVSNVVIHGYRDVEPEDVELTVDRIDGHLVVIVRDHGHGLVPRPDSPGLGMGMDLIRRVTESVDVREPDDGGLELRMTFSLKA